MAAWPAEIEKLLSGPAHPGSTDSRREKAQELSKAGRHREAAEIRVGTVADRRRSFGDKNPETLTDAHNWAFTLSRAGDTDNAIRIYQYVLAAREEVLPPGEFRLRAALGPPLRGGRRAVRQARRRGA